MKIVIGLGNPTDRYKGTRHNIGYMALDRLSEEYRININQHRHKALTGTGFIGRYLIRDYADQYDFVVATSQAVPKLPVLDVLFGAIRQPHVVERVNGHQFLKRNGHDFPQQRL